MKTTLLSLLLVFLALWAPAQRSQAVNAVLGDESFIARFRQVPDESTNEILRLQTHLQYVTQLLTHESTAHLSKRQKQKRALVLRLLRDYRMRGVFPTNEAYRERRPCFIDRKGNICAVGYLIEKTAGRKQAERINQKHQYDYLLGMHDAFIARWAAAHGLTLQECAMIQPTYGAIPSNETVNVPVKTGYGVASGVLSGANAGIMVMNWSTRFAGRSKIAPYMGLVGGTTQLVLGLANIREDETQWVVNGPSTTHSYRHQNNVSYFNIAAGTATLLTSAANLILQKQMGDKRNAVNLYSHPIYRHRMVAGLSYVRTL